MATEIQRSLLQVLQLGLQDRDSFQVGKLKGVLAICWLLGCHLMAEGLREGDGKEGGGETEVREGGEEGRGKEGGGGGRRK